MAKPARPIPADPKAAPAPDGAGRPETSQAVPAAPGGVAIPVPLPSAGEALEALQGALGPHAAVADAVPPPAPPAAEPEAVTEPSPGEPPAPRPVWRDVALCLRATTVYFGGALVKLQGGEWIEERERVAVVRRDPSFQVFAVESPAHLAFLRAGYERELANVRRLAAALGYVLFRDGEIDPARRR